MKDLENRLSEIEGIADQGVAHDDALAQSMGRELKARVRDMRDFIGEGGEAAIAACWMYDAQELRAELIFTMTDPDASRIGMGSLYKTDNTVATAAASGRRFFRKQAEKARKSRKRTSGLKVRGLVPFREFAATELCDRLDADGQLVHEHMDEEEFRITRNGDHIVIYSYTTDEETTLPADQLRAYLNRARNS